MQACGYNVAVHGQKGFNGVALLSKSRIEDVRRGLPGDDADVQARYIEGTIVAGQTAVRVGGLYLPNGNPIGTEKFTYKLAWMRRFEAHARSLLADEMPVVLAGDYNVIPEPVDAKQPGRLARRCAVPAGEPAGVPPADRPRTDRCDPGLPSRAGVYTFWDYQAGAWQKDNGIRIDHLLLSPQAADRLRNAGIDQFTRALGKTVGPRAGVGRPRGVSQAQRAGASELLPASRSEKPAALPCMKPSVRPVAAGASA